MNARAWFYGLPGVHAPRFDAGRMSADGDPDGAGDPVPTRLPYAEQVPTVAATAQALRPYLRLLSDLGWPGLSSRDRTDIGNLFADLEAASERLVR